MQLGMVGLGRMGSNIVRRLMRGGHACVSFDLNLKNVEALENEGSQGARLRPSSAERRAKNGRGSAYLGGTLERLPLERQ